MKKILFSIFVLIFSAVAASSQTANTSKETAPTEKVPVSYGIVVDNSGSYRMIFNEIIKSVSQIIEANNPDDEAFLVRFVDTEKISLLQDLTSSKDELQSATEEMFIEGGQTAILDGVYFSAKHLASGDAVPTNNRKVLILISDGEDRKSESKIGNVLKFLKDEKIQVFTLGLADGKVYRSLLEKLAKETGGKSYIVENRSGVGTVIKQLTTDIRAR